MSESTALAERPAAEIAAPSVDWESLRKAIIDNDLSKLTDEEKVRHYASVCHSVGLNPATQPLGYITLKGKLTLYALKGATDQLRRLYGVSIYRVDVAKDNTTVRATVYARTPDGREDSDIGVVSLRDAIGVENAEMKAVTKGKRRVTLSICGLGMLDETEVESIPSAATPPALVANGGVSEPTTNDRLIDATTSALMELSGIEKTSGKKLMTEAAKECDIRGRDFSAFTNRELKALGDWARARIARHKQGQAAVDPATADLEPEVIEMSF